MRLSRDGACVSPGMRANPSTCRVLTLVGTLSDSRWWCTCGRTAGRATLPEWIHSQGFYEPRAGGEIRTFGSRFYTNKQTNKQTNKTVQDSFLGPNGRVSGAS